MGAGSGLVVNLNSEFKIMSLQININLELILVLNQNQLLFHLSFLPLSWVGKSLCATRGWFGLANFSSSEITRCSKTRDLEIGTEDEDGQYKLLLLIYTVSVFLKIYIK